VNAKIKSRVPKKRVSYIAEELLAPWSQLFLFQKSLSKKSTVMSVIVLLVS
jgi:hypothetical protein